VLGSRPIPPRQFAVFRALLGAYLAIHFAHLIPYGRELFSRDGVFPRAASNLTYRLFPDPLYVWDSPGSVTVLLVGLVAAALLFALGVARRATAVVLWFGWAALFHRNNLISNPSIPYVGLLLLLTLLVPPGEGLTPVRRRPARSGAPGAWRFPAAVYGTAWIVLAAGYTYSGLVKLGSPSWLDGTALAHVLRNPLARPNAVREAMLALPAPALAALTWSALAAELAALPLSLWRVGRALAWVSLVGLQLGILSVVSFADLTAGMLLAHLFVLDPDWWPLWRRSRGPAGQPASSPTSAAAP
jgi:hypothetical protein